MDTLATRSDASKPGAEPNLQPPHHDDANFGAQAGSGTASGMEAMSILYVEDAGEMKFRPTESLRAPILVVEDERDLAEEIRCELHASGH
jgi:hypothetical protein